MRERVLADPGRLHPFSGLVYCIVYRREVGAVEVNPWPDLLVLLHDEHSVYVCYEYMPACAVATAAEFSSLTATPQGARAIHGPGSRG